jgi:uncharacterized protein YndB with AHSA1/START domain
VSRVRASVDIAAPVEEVFEFFDDLAHAAVLVPQLAEIGRVEAAPGGGRVVEYTTRGRNGALISARSEHVVYEPPHHTVTRNEQAGVTTTTSRDFMPVDGGTRVETCLEWVVGVRYVGGVVSWPLRRPYRQALRDALEGARAAIEDR